MKFIPLLAIALISYAYGEDNQTLLSSIEKIEVTPGTGSRALYTITWKQDHLPEIVIVRFYKSEDKKKEIAEIVASISTEPVYKSLSVPEKPIDPFIDPIVDQRSTSLLSLDKSILDSTVIDLVSDGIGRHMLSMKDLLNLYAQENRSEPGGGDQ